VPSRDIWNDWLGRFAVEGGTEAERVKFYTDLWHALLGRRIVSDVDGSYCDMTGPKPVTRHVKTDAQGQPLDPFWFSHTALVAGGALELELGPHPAAGPLVPHRPDKLTTTPALPPPASPKPVASVQASRGHGASSLVFARSSLWFRYGFAMVFGVSAASRPTPSHSACRTPHTTALPIIETLPRPKWLRRFGGANCPFGLPCNPFPTQAQTSRMNQH